jgi:hydrogenase maturation protease
MARRTLTNGRVAPAPALVIGYGNPLRGDDAVGQEVAAAVARWGLPGVRALAVHQLTPELVEPLARARLAVFVDAYPARDGGGVNVRRLGRPHGPAALGHTGDPRFLLGLARALYGGHPPAWLVTVPGFEFGFGEALSPTARDGVRGALRQVARLLRVAGAPRGDAGGRSDPATSARPVSVPPFWRS